MKHFLAFTHVLFAILWATTGCRSGAGKYTSIQIKGSDTEVNLALSLAETFMAADSTVSVAVTGGGSGTGIAALINGRTDIANSSRPMKEQEIKLAQARGVDPYPIPFAMDGLALIVHSSNPIDSLDLKQIGALFRGEYDNWQKLGGIDLPISIYGRQNNSGTYIFFRDNFLQADYAPSAKQMNGNGQIVTGIQKDPSGIGYVGLGYVVDKNGQVSPGLKVLKVCPQPKSKAVSPLIFDNIVSGRYPITRPLYQFTNGRPSGKTLVFIQYELSKAGQALISQEGYYPLSDKLMAQNLAKGLVTDSIPMGPTQD